MHGTTTAVPFRALVALPFAFIPISLSVCRNNVHITSPGASFRTSLRLIIVYRTPTQQDRQEDKSLFQMLGLADRLHQRLEGGIVGQAIRGHEILG